MFITYGMYICTDADNCNTQLIGRGQWQNGLDTIIESKAETML